MIRLEQCRIIYFNKINHVGVQCRILYFIMRVVGGIVVVTLSATRPSKGSIAKFPNVPVPAALLNTAPPEQGSIVPPKNSPVGSEAAPTPELTGRLAAVAAALSMFLHSLKKALGYLWTEASPVHTFSNPYTK